VEPPRPKVVIRKERAAAPAVRTALLCVIASPQAGLIDYAVVRRWCV
jgi:hypothetical protein